MMMRPPVEARGPEARPLPAMGAPAADGAPAGKAAAAPSAATPSMKLRRTGESIRFHMARVLSGTCRAGSIRQRFLPDRLPVPRRSHAALLLSRRLLARSPHRAARGGTHVRAEEGGYPFQADRRRRRLPA